MIFDWDSINEERHYKKHRVWFEAAANAFSDPLGLMGPDLQHSTVERRFRWFGKSGRYVLAVGFTFRSVGNGETAIRIITARRASRKERKTYKAAAAH